MDYIPGKTFGQLDAGDKKVKALRDLEIEIEKCKSLGYSMLDRGIDANNILSNSGRVILVDFAAGWIKDTN